MCNKGFENLYVYDEKCPIGELVFPYRALDNVLACMEQSISNSLGKVLVFLGQRGSACWAKRYTFLDKEVVLLGCSSTGCPQTLLGEHVELGS